MAGETEGNRTAHRLFEAQFDQAPLRVRLHETALVAEAAELQRAKCATAVLNLP